MTDRMLLELEREKHPGRRKFVSISLTQQGARQRDLERRGVADLAAGAIFRNYNFGTAKAKQGMLLNGW